MQLGIALNRGKVEVVEVVDLRMLMVGVGAR
jgi:hypothetical protein